MEFPLVEVICEEVCPISFPAGLKFIETQEAKTCLANEIPGLPDALWRRPVSLPQLDSPQSACNVRRRVLGRMARSLS